MNDLQTILEGGTQTALMFGIDSEKRPLLSAAPGITACLGSICSWSLIRAPRQKAFFGRCGSTFISVHRISIQQSPSG